MKNLIAISAAALTAATASASIVQFNGASATSTGWDSATYYATWTNVNDTLRYANQTAVNTVDYAAIPGMGIHSWSNWTASSTVGGPLTLIGAYGADARYVTTAPNTGNIVVNFTTNTGNSERGIMGAGIQYTISGTVTGNMTVSFSNGLTTVITLPANAGGFIGVWLNNPIGDPPGAWYKIASITFSTSGTGILAIDNIYTGLVPAPGAVALVGVAGLVGSRRRRA